MVCDTKKTSWFANMFGSPVHVSEHVGQAVFAFRIEQDVPEFLLHRYPTGTGSAAGPLHGQIVHRRQETSQDVQCHGLIRDVPLAGDMAEQ